MNVVVGAGSGLGRAVALALADRGPLLLADVKAAAVESLAATLRGPVTALATSVSDAAEVEALAGRVDVVDALVVTAGLGPSSGPGEPIYEVNLIGMARVLRAFEAKLRPGSVAVCVASTAGHMAPLKTSRETYAVLDDPLAPEFLSRLAATGVDVSDGLLAYLLSKTGVVRLVRQLAAPWGRLGARIVSVSPGVIDTPMARAEEAAVGDSFRAMITNTPLGRAGRPEEIATVISFLSSEGASYITGSDVLVDGGNLTMFPKYQR